MKKITLFALAVGLAMLWTTSASAMTKIDGNTDTSAAAAIAKTFWVEMNIDYQIAIVPNKTWRLPQDAVVTANGLDTGKNLQMLTENFECLKVLSVLAFSSPTEALFPTTQGLLNNTTLTNTTGALGALSPVPIVLGLGEHHSTSWANPTSALGAISPIPIVHGLYAKNDTTSNRSTALTG